MRHALVYLVVAPITESDMSTSIPIRVLILEDNSADAQLMMRELRKAGLDPSAEIVDTEREFSDGLSPQLDLILCDHALPQFNSKQALRCYVRGALMCPSLSSPARFPRRTRWKPCKAGRMTI
jgi:hypothetical protein